MAAANAAVRRGLRRDADRRLVRPSEAGSSRTGSTCIPPPSRRAPWRRSPPRRNDSAAARACCPAQVLADGLHAGLLREPCLLAQPLAMEQSQARAHSDHHRGAPWRWLRRRRGAMRWHRAAARSKALISDLRRRDGRPGARSNRLPWITIATRSIGPCPSRPEHDSRGPAQGTFMGAIRAPVHAGGGRSAITAESCQLSIGCSQAATSRLAGRMVANPQLISVRRDALACPPAAIIARHVHGPVATAGSFIDRGGRR